MSRRTVIVGGVAGGMSTATRLRRLDEQREIVVLERGEHVSFAACGLPYHVGGTIPERGTLLMQTPEQLRERFALDVRTRHEVIEIDRERREVHVRDMRTDERYVERYDELVLATGVSPVRPTLPGGERAHVLRDLDDLDQIMAALKGRPRTAVVVGGGFVGLELAENLFAAGLKVTLVEAGEHVLPPLDRELAVLVAEHLEAHGVTVRTGMTATSLGPDDVLLEGHRDGLHVEERVPGELVVLAVGVRPESGLARAAGLELDDRGGVLVDAQQRTSDPAIFAVGDVATKRDAVTGGPVLVPLAQTANRHGRLVADVIAGREVRSRPVLGTAVVGVLGLTAAAVGWSEERLCAAGRPVRAIHTHPLHHTGFYPGAQTIALKLLVDQRTDEILGAQGVGRDGVDKRIDVIATAMRAGLRASELADLELAYAPQYGAAKDPVVMLGMIADNLAAGLTETVQWHELDAELAAGATLVDVRGADEVTAEPLPGAMHLPLDELRARHTQIPAGRVVVSCAAGQRGHTAARLLRELGHDDVANLDGGFRTWSAGQRSLRPALVEVTAGG